MLTDNSTPTTFLNAVMSTSVDWFEVQSSSQVPCVIHWPGAARTFCEIRCHSEAAFLEALAAAGCAGSLNGKCRYPETHTDV